MNCNNCILFKNKFGRNIRILHPVEDCSGDEYSKDCLIQKILAEAAGYARHMEHILPTDEPGSREKMVKSAIDVTLDLCDLDSYTNWIGDEHDSWVEEAAKAIENESDMNDVPF